jgi:hypothetical protein
MSTVPLKSISAGPPVTLPTGVAEYLGPADVLDVSGAVVTARLADGRAVQATVALSVPYEASVGDVLLVIGRGPAHWVIGVIRGTWADHAATPGRRLDSRRGRHAAPVGREGGASRWARGGHRDTQALVHRHGPRRAPRLRRAAGGRPALGAGQALPHGGGRGELRAVEVPRHRGGGDRHRERPPDPPRLKGLPCFLLRTKALG